MESTFVRREIILNPVFWFVRFCLVAFSAYKGLVAGCPRKLDFLFGICFGRNGMVVSYGAFARHGFALHAVATHNDYVYAAIALASSFRIVGVDGFRISVADNRHPLRSHAKLFVQKPEHGNTACG